MKTYKNISIYIAIILLSLTSSSNTTNYTEQIKRINRGWHISIGMNEEWLKPDFDDSGWDKVDAFESTYSENLSGYTGFIVARKSVKISSKHKGTAIGISLRLANAHQLYVNGHLIGASGELPPKNSNSARINCSYNIPEELIRWNEENVIVIKSFIDGQYSLIAGGEISIIKKPPFLEMDILLSGEWKFETGDSLIYAQPQFDDSQWNDIKVPLFWEDQGYEDLDGFAWYRKSFINESLDEEGYIMLFLGEICDIDQVFLNGEMVGSTGNFDDLQHRKVSYTTNQRKYIVPTSKLKKGKNTIAVRVYDYKADGGIHSGTVGIVSQTKYVNYWNTIRKYK